MWTPIVLAALGLVGMVVVDRRIEAEIQREIAALLKMGVDVRPITPEMDAGPDYQGLRKTLEEETDKPGISEQTLFALETAAKKPALMETVSQDSAYIAVAFWLYDKIKQASAKRDYDSMKRLMEVAKAFDAQLLSAEVHRALFAKTDLGLFDRGSYIYTWVMRESDLQVLAWFRREIEMFDHERFTKAQLSHLGRVLRQHSVHGGSFIKSWWEKAVEAQNTFRKAGELAGLQSLRRTAESIFQSPKWKASCTRIENLVMADLDRQGTWQARWAGEPVILGSNGGELNPHYALIMVDLLESQAKNLPLQPTWSKKYAFNPVDGTPLKVTATGSRLTIVDGLHSLSLPL